MSTKKIDELLGITGGIDDFLDGLSVDKISADNLSEQFKNVDDNVKQVVQDIDNQLSTYNVANVSTINLPQIEKSFSELTELIDTSKQILRHVHDAIVTCELVDSELVQAFAKLFEAAHITISEYIDLYKSRVAFLDKIKFAIFQQEQRKEMELLKHKLAMERMQSKNDNNVVEAENTITYSQEEITKMLNDTDMDNFN